MEKLIEAPDKLLPEDEDLLADINSLENDDDIDELLDDLDIPHYDVLED